MRHKKKVEMDAKYLVQEIRSRPFLLIQKKNMPKLVRILDKFNYILDE